MHYIYTDLTDDVDGDVSSGCVVLWQGAIHTVTKIYGVFASSCEM